MQRVIGLDFETYAVTDLPTNGLDNYVNCEFFTPLIAAVKYVNNRGVTVREVFDFVRDPEAARGGLWYLVRDPEVRIAAHNAGFEQAVLSRMGMPVPSEKFIDTAVLARAAGAAGKLEAAAPQLLGLDKVETGFNLIKLFSIPGKYQATSGLGDFDPQIVVDHPQEWQEFSRYCQVDADLSYDLAMLLLPLMSDKELANTAVTMDMNNVGWFVDMPLVEEMQRRYLDNVDRAIENFRDLCDAPDLNMSSFPQLQAWCKERGVRASSFDETSVQKMRTSLTKRLEAMGIDEPKRSGFEEVLELLHTKQVMGGSSLKKLQTLIDRVGPGSRLRDSYLHIGAGATYRTSGRGVQMQNLKRLNGQGDDVELLYDPNVSWPNDQLASNLRQVFRASHPNGRLIVGDFSSVESRGLAWQAGETWKLQAYARGEGIYEHQAAKIFNVAYEAVTKQQRQTGKVGELSCGYGAGPEAVQTFAAKMGVELSLQEATLLVKDWRDANGDIVRYWYELDAALKAAVGGIRSTVKIPHGWVQILPVPAPESLREQTHDQDLVSLRVSMILTTGETVLTRVIHGAHLKGRNIGYWKPSERKTGALWVDRFMNPKTKRVQMYSMYGGKLSGILTQSLCRELFFDSLRSVHDWTRMFSNTLLIGQFHDEIVVEWWPEAGMPDLGVTMQAMEMRMRSTVLPGFPLDAEIKSDFRYTK
jgi:DNA polymerase